MSAETVMVALQTILPAGTSIQQQVIESALDTVQGGWPGIIIGCPKTEETRPSTGRKQETHTIEVRYIDRWESSARTVGQLFSDARTVLEAMKANVRANKTLTVNGAANALIAGDTMSTEVAGIKEESVPFPLFDALLTIEVHDLWFSG